MKHRLQTLLKHKLQWLVLLTVLLGVGLPTWGDDYYNLVGSLKLNSSTSEVGWDNDTYKLTQVGTSDVYYINVNVTTEGECKVKKNNTWDWSMGYNGKNKSINTGLQTIYMETSWGKNGGLIINSQSQMYQGGDKLYLDLRDFPSWETDNSCDNFKAYLYLNSAAGYQQIEEISFSATAVDYVYEASITTTHPIYSIRVKRFCGGNSEIDVNNFSSTDNCVRVTDWTTGEKTQYSVPSCTGPTVSTNSTASSIGVTTATVKGTVTDGTCEVTEAGICYGTGSSPTISNSTKTVSYTSGSRFTANLTGLSSDTKYYYRAYATTSSGTTYGSDVYNFTTPPELYVRGTFVDEWSATNNNKMTESSGTYTWSRELSTGTTYDFKIAGDKWNSQSGKYDYGYGETDGAKTFTESGNVTLVDVKKNLKLTPSQAGEYSFSFVLSTKVLTVTFPTCDPPTMDTPTFSSIAATSATFGVKASDLGDCSISSWGIKGWTNSECTSGEKTGTSAGTLSTTNQSVTVSGLTHNTTYYFKSFANDEKSSSSVSKKTLITVPDGTHSGVSSTTATLTEAAYDTGGNATTTLSEGAGFIYSTTKSYIDTPNESNATVVKSDVTAVGTTFSYNLTGLSPNTTYYYKTRIKYSVNDGTTYGYSSTTKSFTTNNEFGDVSINNNSVSGVCVNGSTVTWNASASSGSPTSWTVRSSDTSKATADIDDSGEITITLVAAGSATIYATAKRDGYDDKESSGVSISVYAVPSAPTVSSYDASVCSGGTPKFTFSSTSGLTYQMYVGSSTSGSSVEGDGNSKTLTAEAITSSTTFKLRATNSNGCYASSADKTVSITPNASISSVTLSSESVCIAEEDISATANDVELGGGTGAWSSTDESVATITSAGVITPKAAGTTDITYTITDGCGGTVDDEATLTVNPNATASQYTIEDDYNKDYTGSAQTPEITIADGAGDISNYYYSSDNGSTWTAGTPTNAGEYKIKVDVADGTSYCAANGIVIENSFTINKIDQSTPVTINNETLSFCVSESGKDVTLEASGGDGDGTYSFAITGGTVDSDKRSISGSTLTVSAAGTVIVTATHTADNYNDKVSDPVTFTFTDNEPQVFTLTNEGASALCGKGDGSSTGTGGSLRLTGSETGYTYQLKNNDSNYGDPVSGTGNELVFPVTSSGVYTCIAYYGSDPTQCPTPMDVEDGGIIMVVNITPRLIPGTPTVRQYQAVTITSINTEIDSWVLSGEGSDAYTYDQTPSTITLKANTAGSPYRLIATTSAGCTATAVITVIEDTQNCPKP